MDNYAALFGKMLGAGSGGSGTDNYNDLTNKPSINGTVLSGNKTAANLGLQPEISDLSEIRSGAAAGATAVQPAQFETDQDRQENEIGAVANAGAKNRFNIGVTPTVNHTDYTLTDGKLTVSANGTWAHYSVPVDLPAGDYILSMIISDYSKASDAPDTSIRSRIAATTSGGSSIVLQTITGNGTMSVPFTWGGGTLYIQFYPNYNATSYANSFSADDVMLSRAEITDDTFVPYAPTNRELYEMILALQNGGNLTQSTASLISAKSTIEPDITPEEGEKQDE